MEPGYESDDLRATVRQLRSVTSSSSQQTGAADMKVAMDYAETAHKGDSEQWQLRDPFE